VVTVVNTPTTVLLNRRYLRRIYLGIDGLEICGVGDPDRAIREFAYLAEPQSRDRPESRVRDSPSPVGCHLYAGPAPCDGP
jgi:hypothetical protein